MIFLPLYSTMQSPESLNWPMIVASTPRSFINSANFFHFFFGTADVIRSCDSDTQICQGDRPGYLIGTSSNFTKQPPLSLAISATEQERPPAPLSVTLLYRSKSRASLTKASESFF